MTIPQIPDHELLRRIGAGSYGEVWLVRNRTTATLRAAKFVHRREFGDDDRPYQREFEGLLKFEPISRSHPSQLAILHVGQDEAAGCFYYVMELADGLDAGFLMPDAGSTDSPNTRRHPVSSIKQPGSSIQHPASSIEDPASYFPHTLRSELKQHGALPISRCIEIGLALASALEHLHRQGLVHRDIKPSNIVFVNGVPKLADIGLVTDAGDGRSVVGTEGYIPPEGPGTPRADLFSLGKVLYEASTGLDRRQYPQLPPELRARPDAAALIEFNEILLRLCAADARNRYLTAEELHADLGLLQSGRSIPRRRTVERRVILGKRIALAVVVLAVPLGALTFVTARKQGYTPNPEAVRRYKWGQWHYSRLTPEAHGKALEYLTQAVTIDPQFVQPYGEMMALYTWYVLPGPGGEQYRLQKTREIADRALAIDPNAAEGHTAFSWCKFLERDWRGAEDEIRRAIKLNPNLAISHYVYSFYLSMLGCTEEARREGQRAQDLEPPDSERVAAIIAAWPFMAERRFDLAITQLQRSLELDGNFPSAHVFLGDCYDAQSNYVAAIDEFKTYASLVHHDPARVAASYGALREAYDKQGEQGYLRKWIELIRADRSLPDEQQMFAENDLVGYYARLGEKEDALKELEDHFDESQVWHQIKFKAMYDSLHDEPRFKALVGRAGFEK